MKTKKEVKKYIESQEWYDSFVENLARHMRMDVDSYLREIVCQSFGILITCAFIWDSTSQGVEYWGDINVKYLDWLNS